MGFLYNILHGSYEVAIVCSSIGVLCDNLTHWIIAHTYLKASYDVSALLDKEVLFNNRE